MANLGVTPHNTFELGALLVAVGEQMLKRGLIFGAALDGTGRDEMRDRIVYLLHTDSAEYYSVDMALVATEGILDASVDRVMAMLEGE